jgi:phosphocarrier protein HPr
MIPSASNPLRRTVRIVNPLGLHHRVADRFMRTASRYDCTVTVYNGDIRADGKSIWDLLGLVVLPGMEVVIELSGADAIAAIDLLAEILASPGGEDYAI